MQNVNTEEDRNVIPRWRSPRVADGWELSAARDLGTLPLTEALFADQLALWREEGSLAASVDIYDTGILLDDKLLQMEGAGPILNAAKRLPPALLDEVRRSMTPTVQLQTKRERLAQLESSQAYLRQTIRLLKRRIVNYPRDVLALLETARLHVLLGQANAAERYIRRVLALAPNDRLVLRSATQYYKLVGSLETVLPALRNNDAVAYDPLLQSTEIAASDLAGRGSRFALGAAKSMRGVKKVGLRRSELALAVATTERDAGLSQRRVFQLVRAGLATSTENAQAQAVWLGEQEDRPLAALLPNLAFADNAFEARALAKFEAEDYTGAASDASAWLADQPFEPDPVNVICNCHSIYLRTPERALPIAERALALHPDSWAVQNSILLVYIGAGQYDRAQTALANLERIATTPIVRAFASAGSGMLAFARGDPARGRAAYEKAIEAARKIKRPDLVFSAFVFWILAEAKSGSIGSTLLNELSDNMPKLAKRLPIDNRDYADKLWKTIRGQAGEYVDKMTENDEVSMARIEALDRMVRILPDQMAE